LQAQVEVLAVFRDEVVDVMNNSQGVAGWHLNGAIATWGELFSAVPDVESPAACLAQVKADAGREAYLSCLNNSFGVENHEYHKKIANQYAERVLKDAK